MRPDDCTVALLWSKNLESLRAGIAARKPDAVDRVKLQMRKIERELGPLASSLAIMQARARAEGTTVDEGKETTMRARMEILRAQLDDLRPILRNVKAAPHADDRGATPETAARPVHSYDVPEELRAIAEDLRCGWVVRTAGLSAAISAYELRIKGEPGRVAERLERNYVSWQSQMARHRMLTWPIALVVLEGRSALEAARLRGADPRMIAHLVSAGLVLYQVHAAS